MDMFKDLPVTGMTPKMPPPQGTLEELRQVLQPLLMHPQTVEFGWTQTWIGIDSDPELYNIRRTWVRTTDPRDAGLEPYDLRMFSQDHPSLGKTLFGAGNTPYHLLVGTFYNGIRYGNFRDVLLGLYGAGVSVRVSRAGVHLTSPYDGPPATEYDERGRVTPESAAAADAWFAAQGERLDWR